MLTENQDLTLNHKPGHIKHDGHNMTGFIIFLCSESIIFFAFFVGYSVLKLVHLFGTPKESTVLI